MKKRSIGMTVLGVVAGLGTAANADLSGDTVSIELWSSDGPSSFGINTPVVGPGEDTNFFGNQLIDFNAGVDGDIFTIRSTTAFSSIDGAGGRIEWRLTDLDFSEGALVGIDIIQSFSDVSVTSLTATSVTFEYEDIAIPADIYFQARFIPVPAPSAMALFGIAGLVGARRRR